jgi:uncharacterized membrane protein YhhN
VIPWTALCAIGLAVCLLGERRGRIVERGVGKLVASLAFVGAGLSAGLPDVTPGGVWLLAALVLSFVGDMLLLSNDKRWFLTGLVAFLLAHVAFAAFFAALGLAITGVAAGLVGMGALLAVVWPRLAPHTGRLKLPVAAYMAAISWMVASAAGAVAAGAAGPGLLVAAVVFAASDLFVARQRFIHAEFLNRAIGLPLYYGAQLLFVASIP